MYTRIRRFTALVGTTALVGAGSFGVAQAAKNGDDSPNRGRGPTNAQVRTLANELGVSTAKLRAAMAATRPAKPNGTRRDPGGDMAAALAKELGVEASAVEEILEQNRPSRPARGAKPDPSGLINALANGLSLDEATVTDAVEKVHAAKQAEHEARHDEMAAALAKELGLTTAEVEAALESKRP
jgi:hypothetical protein